MRDRCYRVWFRALSAKEWYVDVKCYGEFDALRQAREMKLDHEWIDRWQPLVVPAGNRRPSCWFRLRWAIRRRFPNEGTPHGDRPAHERGGRA